MKTPPAVLARLAELEQEWRKQVAANRAKESRSAVEAATCAATEKHADELATLREAISRPAAVDEAMVERALDTFRSTYGEGYTQRMAMSAALTAALHPAASDGENNG